MGIFECFMRMATERGFLDRLCMVDAYCGTCMGKVGITGLSSGRVIPRL